MKREADWITVVTMDFRAALIIVGTVSQQDRSLYII
jgi:hypothetical protein